jgi:hypothetical protein
VDVGGGLARVFLTGWGGDPRPYAAKTFSTHFFTPAFLSKHGHFWNMLPKFPTFIGIKILRKRYAWHTQPQKCTTGSHAPQHETQPFFSK